MIERKLLGQRVREFQVHEFIASNLKNVGYSGTKIVRTPLGEKIIVYASRPGLVVGRKGENIKKLTNTLKKKFKFENPEIELMEVDGPDTDARIVAERIASSLERFGIQRFKGVGHKALSDVMAAGARGIEILISGKVPSARARTWRFYAGYLKKSGDASLSQVRRAIAAANLKSGTIVIKVCIMPRDVHLPDDMKIVDGVAPVSPVSLPDSPSSTSPVSSDADAPKKRSRKKKSDGDSSGEKPKRSRKKKDDASGSVSQVSSSKSQSENSSLETSNLQPETSNPSSSNPSSEVSQ